MCPQVHGGAPGTIRPRPSDPVGAAYSSPHVHCELPSPAACANVREAEEIERGRFLPQPLRMFRVPPKVHQSGLLRVERQTVFPEPLR